MTVNILSIERILDLNLLIEVETQHEMTVTDPLVSSWASGPYSPWGSSPSGSVWRQK